MNHGTKSKNNWKICCLRACAGESQKTWRSLKFLETSTKWKLFVGGTILPNFSVKICTVPKISQIKECTKWRPKIYWPQFKNAIIEDLLMQMCWHVSPLSGRFCVYEKKIMCYFSYFWDTIFLPFWSKIFICCKIFTSSVIPFLELEAKCY